MTFLLGNQRLDSARHRAAAREVTYPEVGRTTNRDLPAGYHHDRASLKAGVGETAWSRAQQALRCWQAHHHAGVTVTPPDAPLEEGGTVLVSWTFGPLVIAAPCRIVYVTTEPARFGFAYGTLPGHPEQGEEAFHVRRDELGNVTAEIVAFSKPAALPVRVGSPIARLVQTRITERYLDGIRTFVAAGP